MKSISNYLPPVKRLNRATLAVMIAPLWLLNAVVLVRVAHSAEATSPAQAACNADWSQCTKSTFEWSSWLKDGEIKCEAEAKKFGHNSTLVFFHDSQLDAIYGAPAFIPPRVRIFERGTIDPDQGIISNLRGVFCNYNVATNVVENVWTENIDQMNATINAVDQHSAKPISIEDFLVDGRSLADDGAKVRVSGSYSYWIGNDWIASSMRFYGDEKSAIPVVVPDSAPEDVRRWFVRQRQWSAANNQGSQRATFYGHVGYCERTTLLSVKKTPCLTIDGVSEGNG